MSESLFTMLMNKKPGNFPEQVIRYATYRYFLPLPRRGYDWLDTHRIISEARLTARRKRSACIQAYIRSESEREVGENAREIRERERARERTHAYIYAYIHPFILTDCKWRGVLHACSQIDWYTRCVFADCV